MSKIVLILSGVLFLQVSFAGSVKPTTSVKQKRSVSQNVDPVYLPKAQADRALTLLIEKSGSLVVSTEQGCSNLFQNAKFSEALANVLLNNVHLFSKKKSFDNRCVKQSSMQSLCELAFDHEASGEEPTYRAFDYQINTDTNGKPLQVVSVSCAERA